MLTVKRRRHAAVLLRKGDWLMQSVDGVYNLADYQRVEGYLRQYYPQMALFWAIGCDTGFRVSDLLALKIGDVVNGRLSIIERKTKKPRTATLGLQTRANLMAYLAKYGLSDEHYIFCESLIGEGKGVKPVTRQYVWRAVKMAGEAVGLPRLNLEHIPLARRLLGRPCWQREVFALFNQN